MVNFVSRPLDGSGEKFLRLPGLEPGTVQPLANRYIECANRFPLTAKH